MTRETTMIVYSNGAFCEQPAPDWYLKAEELGSGLCDWQEALSQALGVKHDEYAEPLGDAGIEICVWRSPDFGVYVETSNFTRGWDAVWVPSSADWWPFQSQYLVPLIASASNLAIADKLNRIGNVLIARARHGERSPIDDMTGQSWIDIRREQQRQVSYRAKP